MLTASGTIYGCSRGTHGVPSVTVANSLGEANPTAKSTASTADDRGEKDGSLETGRMHRDHPRLAKGNKGTAFPGQWPGT